VEVEKGSRKLSERPGKHLTLKILPSTNFTEDD